MKILLSVIALLLAASAFAGAKTNYYNPKGYAGYAETRGNTVHYYNTKGYIGYASVNGSRVPDPLPGMLDE